MAHQSRTVEKELAQLASRAHGVVTRAGLLRAGVSHDEIRQRQRTGALIRVHRGVYRVGHVAPSLEARYTAAVLACGDGAVLSGRAAAYLLGLIKGGPPAPEVTAPTERRVRGVNTRRSRVAIEAMTWKGIRVTTVARTLVDRATELTPDELARACHEADVRHGTTPEMVDAVLARHPNAHGAAKLRAVLRGDVHILLSKLEKGFVAHVRDLRRPRPVTNRPAGAHFVDCRWPEYHLTVELDSYRYHRTRYAWEQDRRRERDAYARRDDFRRYTWGDVFEDSRAMRTEICALLPEVP